MTMSDDGIEVIEQTFLQLFRNRNPAYVGYGNKLASTSLRFFNDKGQTKILVAASDQKPKYTEFSLAGTVKFEEADYYGNFYQENKHGHLSPQAIRNFYKTNPSEVDRKFTLGTKIGEKIISENNEFVDMFYNLEENYLQQLVDPDQKFEKKVVEFIDDMILSNDDYEDKMKASKDIAVRKKCFLTKYKLASGIKKNKIHNPLFDSEIKKNKFHPEYKTKGYEFINDDSEYLLNLKSYKAFPEKSKKTWMQREPVSDPNNLFGKNTTDNLYDNSWRFTDVDNQPLSIIHDPIKRGDIVLVNFSIQPFVTNEYYGLRLRCVGVRMLLKNQTQNKDEVVDFLHGEEDEEILANLEFLKKLNQTNKRNDSVLDDDDEGAHKKMKIDKTIEIFEENV